MSAQCIIGPKVTFAAQGPVHTMQGHSIRSAHMLFLAEPTFNVSIVFYTLRRSTCSPAKKHTPCALQMQPQQCQHTAHTVPPYSLNADSMLCRTAPVAPNAAPRRSKCMWTCATARARAVTARARAVNPTSRRSRCTRNVQVLHLD